MFSVNFDKSKKELEMQKEKERQKKIDKLIEEAEKKQLFLKRNSNTTEEDGKFLGGSFVKNKYGNLFIKSVILPVTGIIGVGGILWGAGFAVGEVSKVAPFLSDISLPTSITDIIAMSEFWKAVLLIAAICAVIFIISSIFITIKDYVIEAGKGKANRLQISNERNYNLSNHRIHSCEKINNSKENYNYKINKNKQHNFKKNSVYNFARKEFGYKNKLSFLQRNKQIVEKKNKHKFNSTNMNIEKNYHFNKDKMFIEMSKNRIH